MFWRKKKLNHPTREQLSSFRYREDWAFFMFDRNPQASARDVLVEYNYTKLPKRLGLWTEVEMDAIHDAVRAGREERAALIRGLSVEQALRDKLAQCKNWDDWVRAYVVVHREHEPMLISSRMIGERRDLGDTPELERIDELRAEMGVISPEALQAKLAKQLESEKAWENKLLEKLRMLPARLAAARKARVSAQTAHKIHKVDEAAFKTALSHARSGDLFDADEKFAEPARLQVKSELAPETREFLAALALPTELCDFFARHNFDDEDGVIFGRLGFYSADALWRENLEAEQCILNGLLIIGCSETDDPIALNIDTGTVGFINHEEMWSSYLPCDQDDFRESWIDTGLELGTFFRAAAIHKNFPADFYAAKKRAGKFSKFAR